MQVNLFCFIYWSIIPPFMHVLPRFNTTTWSCSFVLFSTILFKIILNECFIHFKFSSSCSVFFIPTKQAYHGFKICSEIIIFLKAIYKCKQIGINVLLFNYVLIQTFQDFSVNIKKTFYLTYYFSCYFKNVFPIYVYQKCIQHTSVTYC